jgi:hypothetical protein
MFGKKKEEEWEFIGTENYFQKDNYGKVADEEYWHKEHTSTDYITEMFKPHLKKNEQILCVVGSGKGDIDDPFKSGKAIKAKYKANKFKITILIIYIVGIILCVLLSQTVFVDYIETFVFLIVFGSISFLIALFLAEVCTRSSNTVKHVNYAITDQRILSIRYKELWQLSLKAVTDTFIYLNSDNTGKLVINACRDLGRPTSYTYSIPNVNEPYRVKAILDDAVAKYKSNLNQG